MTATLHTADHHTFGLPAVDFAHIEAAAAAAVRTLRNVALFAAATLIGLVYAVALPFVGMVMITRIAYQAYRTPALVALATWSTPRPQP